MLPKRTYALLLLSAMQLTACGASLPHVIQAPRLVVPDSLTTCQAQPEPPADPYGDKELASWILDLADAGQDCRDKLATVKGLVQ